MWPTRGPLVVWKVKVASRLGVRLISASSLRLSCSIISSTLVTLTGVLCTLEALGQELCSARSYASVETRSLAPACAAHLLGAKLCKELCSSLGYALGPIGIAWTNAPLLTMLCTWG